MSEQKKTTKTSHWYIGLFLCLALFVFSRLYLLPETLYFWGDIGRDHQVLMEMVQNRRPILLGPSNSQLPFNQSAWYFYINLPVFILSGFSAYTTAITGTLLMVAAFLVCAWIVRAQTKEYSALSILILLLTFQPIILAQQRSTWNPAFALPCILIATFILWEWIHKRFLSTPSIFLFAVSLVGAIGMTYAAVPLSCTFILVALWFLPKREKWAFMASLVVASFFFFLPHILFEVRHGFLLTKQLLANIHPTAQQSLAEKLSTGSFSILGGVEPTPRLGLSLAAVTLVIGIAIARLRKQTKIGLTILLSTVFVSFIVSCLFVSEFNTHYSLVLSVVLLFVVSKLPPFWSIGISMALLFLWSPFIKTPYIQSPHRTVDELEQCAQLVCQKHPEPMYVSAQAWHDFHSGYDYSFFMNKNGCHTRDIGTHPQYSNTLALVVDRADFDEARTSFYELTLFGPKEASEKYQCKTDLSVHIFEKKGL